MILRIFRRGKDAPASVAELVHHDQASPGGSYVIDKISRLIVRSKLQMHLSLSIKYTVRMLLRHREVGGKGFGLMMLLPNFQEEVDRKGEGLLQRIRMAMSNGHVFGSLDSDSLSDYVMLGTTTASEAEFLAIVWVLCVFWLSSLETAPFP